MISRILFTTLSLFWFAGPVFATELKKETYSNPQGYVQITSLKKTTFEFQLVVRSLVTDNLFAKAENGDKIPRFCEISGEVKFSEPPQFPAVLDSNTLAGKCKLTFNLQKNVLSLTSENCDLCKDTSPDGVFHIPQESCYKTAMTHRRNEYFVGIKKRKYKESIEALQKLMDECSSDLSKPDQWMLLNDIALAKHKMGDKPGCLTALSAIPIEEESRFSKQVLANKQLCAKHRS